jgi:hypothetical protein
MAGTWSLVFQELASLLLECLCSFSCCVPVVVAYCYDNAFGVGSYLSVNEGRIQAPDTTWFNDADYVQLLDGVALPFGFEGLGVLITCPSLQIHKEYEKHAGRKYMPSFTEEEVWELWEHCFDSSAPDMSSEEVEARLRKWGPVPRHVLTQVDSRTQAMLDDSVHEQGMNALKAIVTDDEVLATGVNFNHNFIHFSVDTKTFRRTAHDFASQYVTDIVVDNCLAANEKLTHEYIRLSLSGAGGVIQ